MHSGQRYLILMSEFKQKSYKEYENTTVPVFCHFATVRQSICVLDCSRVRKYFRLSVALFFIGKMYCKVEQEHISLSSTPKHCKLDHQMSIIKIEVAVPKL